jgi:hypothetical protein
MSLHNILRNLERVGEAFFFFTINFLTVVAVDGNTDIVLPLEFGNVI